MSAAAWTTDYGFAWRPEGGATTKVDRIASIDGRAVLFVWAEAQGITRESHPGIEVYVSKGGRRVRVWDRKDGQRDEGVRMTTDDFMTLVRDAYAHTAWGEDYDLADLDELGLDELDDLTARIVALKSALGQLQAGIDRRFADRLQGGSVRLGEWVYRETPKSTEKITDPKRLVEWLGDDWHHVIPCTPSTTLRQGGLKAVLEQRGMSLEAFRDTFLTVEWSEPKVTRLPVDKAPKYLRASAHGDIIPKS